jgi:hypothetical protein
MTIEQEMTLRAHITHRANRLASMQSLIRGQAYNANRDTEQLWADLAVLFPALVECARERLDVGPGAMAST